MEEAEGFIIASPVYNGGVIAQTKTVMDRTRALLAADPEVFRGKAGMAIAIGGTVLGARSWRSSISSPSTP